MECFEPNILFFFYFSFDFILLFLFLFLFLFRTMKKACDINTIYADSNLLEIMGSIP